MVLVNVKLDVTGYKRIMFQVCRLWFISNGTAKTKLAILASFYCDKFVKNSTRKAVINIFQNLPYMIA